MGSKISKVTRATPAKSKTAVPRIPQDIIDEILDHLTADSDPSGFLQTCAVASLRSCALVSISWVRPCRRHLFHSIPIVSWSMRKWIEAFPVLEESPSHYVRAIHIWTGGTQCVPEKLSEYASWFPNTEKMCLVGNAEGSTLPPYSCLEYTGGVTLVQVRDVMAQLPNLHDLSLSMFLVAADSRELPGIGTVLRGRFGGKLSLCGQYADKDTINMLLEVPSGLRFTEVRISCTCDCLLSTVRLVEACGDTLVKLSHMINVDGKSHPSHNLAGTGVRNVDTDAVSGAGGIEACEQSFDFSKFPNLQEVDFGLSRIEGSPHWIPKALSTLRPATSPRLSTIRLNFIYPPTADPPVATLVKTMGNDLRWVADEFTRIEREFERAVNLTVVRGPGFEALLDTLNVRFHFRGPDEVAWPH